VEPRRGEEMKRLTIAVDESGSQEGPENYGRRSTPRVAELALLTLLSIVLMALEVVTSRLPPSPPPP